ncbi:spherulation-specific family 4 protein [Streptomyces sp. RPT161]|uniref:spherulation-specific family 4 protein n=1 Tax=Streptomyces sp. RPT161 TaxID=3015993 RepID=UPI003FCD5832
MPHLTSGAMLAGFGVPMRATAATAEWVELAQTGAPLHWVVVDLVDGPGRRRDPRYAEVVTRLRDAGVRVLGRLNTAYGGRTFAQLVGDAHHFMDWYGITGFYLDRAPTDRDWLPECRRVAATLHAMADGADSHLVLGHGIHPYPGYAEAADQLVTYLGPWTRYRWSQAPPWTAEHPPERFCHLVHSVPRPHLETAMRIARWQGAATVHFTDQDGAGGVDPWREPPSYWDEAVEILRNQSPPSR